MRDSGGPESIIDYERDEARSERIRALREGEDHPLDCRCRPCQRREYHDQLGTERRW